MNDCRREAHLTAIAHGRVYHSSTHLHPYRNMIWMFGREDVYSQFRFGLSYPGIIWKCTSHHHYGNIQKVIINHLDKVIEMIRNGKPVVMLAFCAEGWPWDWNGHAYVIDGYKSDETGRYFHINWGWNGKQDGYYAVGCFNERSRSGIEEGIDSGYQDAKPSNYNLFHYYVHYEI